MLLQTNSYVVPKDKRNEHARLVRRFRQSLAKLGCGHFEVYEQVSQNWGGQDSGGRYVQIMRFRDRRHQLDVQAAERSDPTAQALIQEFCELINFPFQQQQGLFAVGFYTSLLPAVAAREPGAIGDEAAPAAEPGEHEPATAESADASEAVTPPEQQPAAIVETTNRRGTSERRNGDLKGKGSVEPIFFDSSPAAAAAAAAAPMGPKLASDELDSGLTDLSDSRLMELDDLDHAETTSPAAESPAASPAEPPAQTHMRLAQDVVDDSDVELFDSEEPTEHFGDPPSDLSLRHGSQHDSIVP